MYLPTNDKWPSCHVGRAAIAKPDETSRAYLSSLDTVFGSVNLSVLSLVSG